ncbi:hypothetical protein BDV96DRAFT_576070 [Lophiotrema nucula]|uniref:DUF7605 domain-containing protein n=1 Tax=Lophiotrema nucula TaxID=690887 RepID=A0A6A5Z772_9PLEO|nr:hypothetical protein BDV96DRAFT_576070 [Lophiotrema nucula]
MAACSTMAVRDPLTREPTPTPRPIPTPRLITKRMSFQSLRSPVLLSPVGGRPFPSPSLFAPSQDSPGWEHINVISPSTASHHSVYSDIEEGFRSPRLALLTSNLSCNPQHGSEGMHLLISPSAPVQVPGDELLYDIATEQKPDDAFFNAEFQAALAATKQEMKDISLAIWGCPISHRLGSDLHALKQWAQQLSEFEPTRTRTIGFVGESGVGKSSVINALLDQPHLAHSSIDGKFSTSVITEYRFRPAHHDEPFGLEVDYLSSEEIKELIEELLRSFRACYIPAFQAIDGAEERQHIKERSEKAWQTLHSMYRDQPIFTREFVLEHTSDIKTPLVGILQRWTAKFLAARPGGLESRTWSATAFNTDECRDKLDAFTRNPLDQSTAALWPLVRVVRIYLRSPILQSGLVVVDCPSPRILNFARSRATERYLRNCHEVFGVTTMDDALSDQCIADIIRRNGRHRPLRIICTKSEAIDPREVERTQPEIRLQTRAFRQQIETLQKQTKRAEAQRRQGILGALEEEVRSRDMLEDMEHVLKKFLSERRNLQTTNHLLAKYAPQVQVGELRVFCVSNTDYFKHRYDDQSRAESRLELSGIIELRRYCHSIPADAQFDTAVAYIEHDVPAFLGSLKQWAIGAITNAGQEQIHDIRQLMQVLEGQAIQKLVLPTAQIQQTRSILNQHFASSIVSPIRENRGDWRNAALDASKEWSKWDAKVYAAFCRQQGTHWTKETGVRSWNEELISPMRLRIETNWNNFQHTIEQQKTDLLHSLGQVFDELCEPLKAHLPSSPVQNLLETMPSRLATISHIINTGFADLQEGTQQIESDTLFGHTSSYINALMAPAYHAASILPTTTPPSSPTGLGRSSTSSSSTSSPTKDPGSSPRSRSQSPTSTSATLVESMSADLLDAKRKHLLTTHIATSRIFARLASMVEKSHRSFVRVVFDGMVASITREVDALIRDLHLVVPGEERIVKDSDGVEHREREKGEAERYAEFAGRLKVRIVAAERVMRDCRGVVEEVSRSVEEPYDETLP